MQIFLALWLMMFSAQEVVKQVDLQQLKSATQVANDTLYVVNFWATWCKPCVEEMPYFIQTANKWSGKKVKLIFVSLNSVKEKAAVEKFVTQHKIQQEVLLLNAGNPNIWINEIEPQWGGSIPATIFYKKGKKVLFHEGEMNATELDSIINLNNK